MSRRTRVLLVDDQPGVLRFVSIQLSQAGYEVITTTSGEEAVRLVESEEPELVLLDLLMVPVGGFEVLERVRAFSQVPVIILTALGTSVREAKEMGASDLIRKPFEPRALMSKVEQVLAERKPGAEATN